MIYFMLFLLFYVGFLYSWIVLNKLLCILDYFKKETKK